MICREPCLSEFDAETLVFQVISQLPAPMSRFYPVGALPTGQDHGARNRRQQSVLRQVEREPLRAWARMGREGTLLLRADDSHAYREGEEPDLAVR
ncbi:MAG: hypothetical protein ACYDB1_03805 [Acidiferrobacteraceae bacterium]